MPGEQHPELVIADIDGGVRGIHCQAGVLTDGSDNLFLFTAHSDHADGALTVHLADLLEQSSEACAPQNRSGEQGQQFGFP